MKPRSAPRPSALSSAKPSALPPAIQQARAELAQRWRALAPRERQGLGLALAALALLLLWLVAIAPALKTLRTVPAQRAVLDPQYAAMQAQAQEARELRALPPLAPEQADAALRAATTRLGAGARLTLTGERATVVLAGVDAAALTAWLAEVRSGARARVVELQVNRSGSTYSGNVVLTLGRPG
jgi:general secretion pathway protein M